MTQTEISQGKKKRNETRQNEKRDQLSKNKTRGKKGRDETK